MRKDFSQDEVPLATIIDYLARDAKKVRNYTFLPIFVFFMTVLVTMMFADRIDWTLHTSDYYSLKQEAFDLSTRKVYTTDPNGNKKLNFEGQVPFLKITQRHQFYPWLEKFVTSAYQLGTMEYKSQMIPLDLLLIRQMRAAKGSGEECWDDTTFIVDPFTRSNILSSATCYLPRTSTDPVEFRGGEGEAGNTVLNISWVPNNKKEERGIPFIAGREIIGRFHSMGQDPMLEYSEACYLEGGDLPECLRLVKQIQDGNFFDGGAQMISVDIFSYFPNQQQYVGMSFVIDVSPSGFLAPEVVAGVFRLYSTSRTSHLLLLLGDIVIICFALVLFFITVKEVLETVRLLRDPSKKWKALGFWDLLSFALAVMLVWVSIQRFRLWGIAAETLYRREDTLTNMRQQARVAFELYGKIDGLYVFVYELMSFCFLVCGIKFFYFMQYVKGLNVVTSTLRHCMDNLIGLAMLFISMIFVYAVIGNVLFGQIYAPMRTVPLAATFLVRSIIAGELDGYDVFVNYNSLAAYIFFGSMYIFFWLLIINLVLGAISSAFLSFDRLNDADSIADVFRTYFLLRGAIFTTPRHMSDVEDSMMSASVRAASEPLRVSDNFLGRVKLLIEMRREKILVAEKLILELKKYRDPADAVVTREFFAEQLPEMAARVRERIFDMAIQIQKSKVQTGFHAEKKHAKVVASLNSLETLATKTKDIWRQEAMNTRNEQKKVAKAEAKFEKEKKKRDDVKEKFRNLKSKGGRVGRRRSSVGSESGRVSRKRSTRTVDTDITLSSSESELTSTDSDEDEVLVADGNVEQAGGFSFGGGGLGGSLDALAMNVKNANMGLSFAGPATNASLAGKKGPKGAKQYLKDPVEIDNFVGDLFGFDDEVAPPPPLSSYNLGNPSTPPASASAGAFNGQPTLRRRTMPPAAASTGSGHTKVSIQEVNEELGLLGI